MEYYIYVILIFAIVLKLTVYLCWYQVRQRSRTSEVRIIMPDGSTRCAVITARGRVHQLQRSQMTSEERQNLPQADSLSPYDNQGMVECPVQPHYGDVLNSTGPSPFTDQEWKLPKYEEVAGLPPPYSTIEPEMGSAVQPGDSAPPMQTQEPPPAYPSSVSIPMSTHPNQAPYVPPPCSPPVTSEELVSVVSPMSSSSGVCMVPTSATSIPSSGNHQ